MNCEISRTDEISSMLHGDCQHVGTGKPRRRKIEHFIYISSGAHVYIFVFQSTVQHAVFSKNTHLRIIVEYVQN
jgi:hypothetical protein